MQLELMPQVNINFERHEMHFYFHIKTVDPKLLLGKIVGSAFIFLIKGIKFVQRPRVNLFLFLPSVLTSKVENFFCWMPLKITKSSFNSKHTQKKSLNKPSEKHLHITRNAKCCTGTIYKLTKYVIVMYTNNTKLNLCKVLQKSASVCYISWTVSSYNLPDDFPSFSIPFKTKNTEITVSVSIQANTGKRLKPEKSPIPFPLGKHTL